MLFGSPSPSCIFPDQVDVTGKRVLESSLLKLPGPDLFWQRTEGLCKHFQSLWAAKDISTPHLPSLSVPLPLGVQAGSSSLQVGAILGEDLALLRCLCGCSQQDYFHSKCVTAVNKWEMGGVAGAVWTIKGNASALHMLWRGRVSVCRARGDVVRDRVWREGVCMKTREESNWERVGGWWQGNGTGRKGLRMAVKRESAWKGLGDESVCERIAKRRCEAGCLWVARRWMRRLHHAAKQNTPSRMLWPPFPVPRTTQSFYPVNTLYPVSFLKQKSCGITAWGGCQGSARAVHPFKQ